MNKKIIALAVAAGLAAPMAAQAAPTVYGKLHMSVGTVEETDNTTVPATIVADSFQVNNHNSRLGFKGSEDLGGGMSAVYKIEYAVDPDSDNDAGGDGTAGIKRRNQYVGLKGNFGEVRVGRHDTPLKMSQGKFDLFNDTFGDIKAVTEGDQRLDNVIAYLNKFNDLSLAVALIPGEGDGVTVGDGIADTTSVALMYNAGPIYAAIALDSYDDTAAGTITEDRMRLTGTYKMGAMRLGLMYETVGTSDNTDSDGIGLNFSMDMGKNVIKAQYLMGDQDTVGEATQLSIGVDHKLSKKTTAYVMYNTYEDEDTAGVTGTEKDQLVAGMIINF